jgi:hypothetical protein
MLALVSILTLFAITGAITHADGPLDGSLGGLDELQGAEFGDLDGVVSPTPVVIPTPRVAVAPPPASAVEAPAAPITQPPDVAAPEGVAPPSPATAPSGATMRLPAPGSGARLQPLHAAPAALAAATMLALAGAGCALASLRTTRPRTRA